MMKISYTGNAILLEPEMTRRIATERSTVKAVAQAQLPVAPPPDILKIQAEGVHTGARVTWNVWPVPHHGVAGGSQGTPNRFHKWFAKLRSLTRLRDGWDSYTAPAPSLQALKAAELYLSTLELLRWEPTRVEASVMGGVGVTHRVGIRKVYVEFYNDLRVHALFSDRTPNMQTVPVGADIQSYYRFIGKAREYLNG